MKNRLLCVLFLTLLGFTVVDLPANAEQICKVTDPTETPLNVRDRPNGEVINSLRNGREVFILDAAYDNENRQWVKIGGYYEGEYRIWGWVIREFISCYDR